MTERTRLEEKREPPVEQQWKKQLQMMNVFDALVYNTDRNRGNMLITPDWKLWMIDHTRAFRRHADAAEVRDVQSMRARHVPEAQGNGRSGCARAPEAVPHELRDRLRC